MTNKKLSIEDYKSILTIVYKSYNKYCQDWISTLNKSDLVNLKKKYVSDIYHVNKGLDLEFKNYIYNFTWNISTFQLEIEAIIGIINIIKVIIFILWELTTMFFLWNFKYGMPIKKRIIYYPILNINKRIYQIPTII